MTERSDTIKKTVLDYTLLITILPGVLYLGAYLHDFIKFTVFKIPTSFISIDLNAVLAFGGFVFFAVALWACFIYYFVIVIEEIFKKHLRRYHLTLSGFSFVIYLIIFNMLGVIFKGLSFTWLGIIPLILLLAMIITAFLASKHRGQHANNDRPQTLRLFIRRISQDYSLIICAVYVLIPLTSLTFGYMMAERSTAFYTIPSKQTVLILAKSDKYFFCRKYDAGKQVLNDSLIMVPMPTSETVTLGLYHAKIDFDKFNPNEKEVGSKANKGAK